MDKELEYLERYENFLHKRRYRPRTIAPYVGAIRSLIGFSNAENPEAITFDQISDFVSFLVKRKKAAPATIRLYVSSFDIFFNTLLSKNYDVLSLKIPQHIREIPEILTPLEVRQILNSPRLHEKHCLVLTLIYSAGLEISQALRIVVNDIDFDKQLIKVRNSKGEIIREAILAEKLIPLLKSYIDAYRPTKWLFEGSKIDSPLSSGSIQKSFKRVFRTLDIDKDVSVRNLKYSYAKHMEMYGVPLSITLDEMGITNPITLSTYSQMGVSDMSISFSPLDMIIHESSSQEFDTTAIEKSFKKIQNEEEKSYLLEAIKCLKARAPRAAVVFAWNAAIRNIQHRCLECNMKELNNAIRKHSPKASWVKTINDFENIKERNVVEASHTLDIFTKREKKVLVSCLDLRNQCGHPGKYMPDELKVAAFLEDLYKLVFSKPSPYHDKSLKKIKKEQYSNPRKIFPNIDDDEIPF